MLGRSFRDFEFRLRTFESRGVRIRYLAPAGLVELKEGSWREKDRLDVEALREILRREAGGASGTES
jgi:hypothetical protein